MYIIYIYRVSCSHRGRTRFNDIPFDISVVGRINRKEKLIKTELRVVAEGLSFVFIFLRRQLSFKDTFTFCLPMPLAKVQVYADPLRFTILFGFLFVALGVGVSPLFSFAKKFKALGGGPSEGLDFESLLASACNLAFLEDGSSDLSAESLRSRR